MKNTGNSLSGAIYYLLAAAEPNAWNCLYWGVIKQQRSIGTWLTLLFLTDYVFVIPKLCNNCIFLVFSCLNVEKRCCTTPRWDINLLNFVERIWNQNLTDFKVLSTADIEPPWLTPCTRTNRLAVRESISLTLQDNSMEWEGKHQVIHLSRVQILGKYLSQDDEIVLAQKIEYLQCTCHVLVERSDWWVYKRSKLPPRKQT